MSTLPRYAVVLAGAIGWGAAGAFFASGCGSGDNGPGPTAEGGSDSTTDVSQSETGTGDAMFDGTVDSAPPDSGDSGPGEAGPTDAADAGDVITPPDAAALAAFPGQVANAFCRQIGTCCFGADASAFDLTTCAAQVLPSGYAQTLRGAIGLVDSGLLILDPVKAQACLSDLAAIDCTANVLTAQTNLSTIRDCTAALTGSLGMDASCPASIACAPNLYCNTPSDGGLGNCVPQAGDGGSCDYGSAATSELACSPRGTGINGLRCVNRSLVSPYTLFDASTWTCGPTLDAGSGCYVGQDCASGICDSTSHLCVASDTFATAGTCTFYTLPEAGHD